MKLSLPLSLETRRILDGLAEEKDIEPARLVHQWLRDWAWQRPNATTTSIAAQASALIQRGTLVLNNGKKVTRAELEACLPRYAIPTESAEGEFVVELGHRLASVLPQCIAYIESVMTEPLKSQRGWNDLRSWATEVVVGKCADLEADLDAKDAIDEETALYAKKPGTPGPVA